MLIFQLIKKNIKIAILKFFEVLGYKLKGIKNTVQNNNFDSIQKFILNQIEKKNEFTIFDVGANVGQSIERFRKNYENCKIFSFEPSQKIFEILKKKHLEKNNYLFNLALSDKSEVKILNSFKYHHINSFYKLEKNSKFELSRKLSSNDEKNFGMSGILNDEKNFSTQENVNCITLDEFAKANSVTHIDILKIDTQGSEPEVLKGAEEFLKEQKISIIEIELIIGVAYERKLSFYDLEKIISNYGYKLIAISEGGNIISYSSYQVDLIYVNEMIFKKIIEMDKKNLNIKGVMRQVDEINKSTY